jgi:hypothetical protein
LDVDSREATMRLAIGLLLAAVVVNSGFAQSSTRAEIRQGSSRASIEVSNTEPYDGGPWAAVPANPLRSDAAVSTDAFRVRAWIEASKTRVVLCAVRREKPEHECERRIATFPLERGESRHVAETD